MNPIIFESTLSCPQCGYRKTERMSADACLWFYECLGCHSLLKPIPGDCCVFCSYGDIPCPPFKFTVNSRVIADKLVSSYTPYMRLINLFLITLLCFAIPFQGIAGMVLVKTSCSAESAGAMAVDTDDEHACCNDAETVAKTGKLCKAEKDCQPASPGMVNPTETSISAVFGGEKITVPGIFARAFYPSATWRPPTPI
ncbi:MAG: hypothetical protein LUQ11_13440 [Methylococcaceae bacterium]|nr:hypothetical protein [Methylococcaceae bacterium]